MNNPTRNRAVGFTLAALFALAVLGLTACGTPEPQSVEERAQARWDHLLAREFEQAYQYYAPGFRETTPLVEFQADLFRRPIRWLAAEVLGSSCVEDVCRVSVEITYRVPGATGPLRQLTPTRTVEERWIRLDGVWWHASN